MRIGWNYRPNSALKGSINYAWRYIQNAAHTEAETDTQHRFVFPRGLCMEKLGGPGHEKNVRL